MLPAQIEQAFDRIFLEIGRPLALSHLARAIEFSWHDGMEIPRVHPVPHVARGHDRQHTQENHPRFCYPGTPTHLSPSQETTHTSIPSAPRLRPTRNSSGTASSCATTENPTSAGSDASYSTPIKALPANQSRP